MASSLLAGVSGLRAHQGLLDVVGNNLANINTPGYKSARATFTDLISETLAAGNGSTAGSGGVNPSQIGLGVRIGAIDQDLRQGSFQNTGRTLDLGIEGEGFFVVSNGKQDLYTRVGTFDLDAENNLVSTSTGFRVQSVDGRDIVIDVDASLPAQATQEIKLTGNLDAGADAPAQAILSSLQPFHQGFRPVVTGASGEPFALADGMTLLVKVNGGAAQTVVFNASDFADIANATAAEVASVINTQISGLQASAVGGAVELTTVGSGDEASIDIDDGVGSPAGVLGLSTALVFGSEAPANASTQLNDLPENSSPYVPGDKIHFTGTDADGTPVSATFVYGSGPGQNGTTLGDLMAFVQGLYPASTLTLLPDGTLQVEANAVGEAPLQLALNDDPANLGFTAFSSLPFAVTTEGSAGATLETSIDVVDAQGGTHTVRFVLHKTGANEWEATADLPDGDGTVIDGKITGIVFKEDGSFSHVAGVGVNDQNIELTFDGFTASQTIELNLGTSGAFDGLTQFGGSSTAGATDQDGFQAGSLSSLSVNSDGAVVGIYTNGRVQELAQIQVATFKNPAGLEKVGDSLYAVSSNSGAPLPGKAQSGRAGKIVSGVLENSNVDIALEFTRLITAQRGFQVNSRTITTTDQLLQELANLIR
ncbi:MAG: flagellar hook-basal body complex protein [Planctomycetota bacterium]|nr:MAG: flagellar hook-basal body complex protein [Planctomycetota bacterium]